MVFFALFRSRKAQVNQAFIYIFMIIMIGSIVVISFVLFNRGSQAACDAEQAAFLSNLEKFASRYTDFDTIHRETLSVPCDVQQLCVLNYAATPESDGSAPFVIQELLNSQELDNNIVLKFGQDYRPVANIPELRPIPEYQCFDPDGGRFKLEFRGKGQYTEISNICDEETC